jgi:hypothetical protein
MTLDNIKMNAVTTSPRGVVNHLTIFSFSQNGDLVSAHYAGGPILAGYLVGMIHGQKISFSFCQQEPDGNHTSGSSDCDIRYNEQGKLQLVEHFTWSEDRGGSGVNILQEL